MLKLVNDPSDGLINSMDCSFLNSSMNTFRNAFCVKWIPPSFEQAILLFVSSVCGLFASICIYIVAARLKFNLQLIEKYNKLVE